MAVATGQFEELLREFPANDTARGEYAGLLVTQGRLEDAKRELVTLVDRAPENAEYLKRYTDLLIQRGEFDEAEGRLKQLIDSGEQAIGVMIAYARVLSWNGRQAEALGIYQKNIRVATHLSRDEELLVADLLMELDRPGEAIVLYDQLAVRRPDDPALVAGRLLARARLGDRSGAIEAAGQLDTMTGFRPSDKTTLADTLYRENRPQLALMIYQQLYNADPSNIDLATKIVRCHVRLYQLPAAAAVLRSHDASMEDVRLRLAKANYKTVVGEHAGAYAIYRSLLDEVPSDSIYAIAAIKGMGSLHLAMGDPLGAESYFRHGWRLSPSDPEIKGQLAESLRRQDRISEAVSTLRGEGEFYEGLPGSPSPKVGEQIAVADMLLRAKRYDESESIARMGLSVATGADDQIQLRTILGRSLLKQGRTSEAIDALRRAEAMTGSPDPSLRYGLYQCLQRLGERVAAQSVLADELQSFGPATNSRIELANLAMQEGDGALAERLMQQAVMFDATNVYVRILLGEARAMVGRINGSQEDRPTFEDAITRAPQNIRARLGLARSHARMSQFDSASQHYQSILAALPNHELVQREHARMVYAWKGVDEADYAYRQAEAVHQPEDFLPSDHNPMVDLSILQAEYEQAGLKLSQLQTERIGKRLKNWRPTASRYQFAKLIEMDPQNQEAIFDDAQLLTILGQTRDAIARYQQLLRMDPDHVEAKIALRRLQLELRPQVDSLLSYEIRRGRDGLSDIALGRLETVTRLPRGDQDDYIMAGYAYRFLDARRGDDADGNVAIIGGSIRPIDPLRLFARVDIEDYDNGFSTRPTFQTGIHYRTAGDTLLELNGLLQNVTANGESLRQDIYYGGFELAATRHLSWRWKTGGRYRYTEYSDDNSAHEAVMVNEYLMKPGRHQWIAKTDANLISFEEPTGFGPVRENLFGVEHPYFSPSGFVFLTAGVEYRTWLSRHNFLGSDERWISIYGGARVDSDSEGYGLARFRAHRDVCGWMSAHLDTGGIFSSVYQSFDVSALITIRLP